MAIKKIIRQEDGVSTEYHRILFVQITPNRQNSIAVMSYVDQAARQTDSGMCEVYSKTKVYEVEYNPTMTVEAAYNRIKEMPQFKGAEDV